jgi:hypothetical protein
MGVIAKFILKAYGKPHLTLSVYGLARQLHQAVIPKEPTNIIQQELI